MFQSINHSIKTLILGHLSKPWFKKTVWDRDFGCNIKVFGLTTTTIAVAFTRDFLQCQGSPQNHNFDANLKPHSKVFVILIQNYKHSQSCMWSQKHHQIPSKFHPNHPKTTKLKPLSTKRAAHNNKQHKASFHGSEGPLQEATNRHKSCTREINIIHRIYHRQ